MSKIELKPKKLVITNFFLYTILKNNFGKVQAALKVNLSPDLSNLELVQMLEISLKFLPR